jgi:hypothetical protein
MSIVIRILVILLVIGVLAGIATLAVSGLSPSIKHVTIVIPDDRFPH